MPLRKGLNAPTLVENKQISLKIYHSFILSTTLSFSPMFTTFYYNLKKLKRHQNFQVPNIIQISNMDFSVPHSLTLLKHLLSKPPYPKQWHIEWEKLSIRVSPHTIYHFKTSSLLTFPNSKEVLQMKRSYPFLKAFQIPTSYPPLHMQDLQPPYFVHTFYNNMLPKHLFF